MARSIACRLAWCRVIAIAIGLLLGTWLNWLIVSRRLRVYSHAVNDSLTLPAYFEFRFADKTRLLRVISAVFILLFFLFYTSSGLVAAGKLFESTFGMGYTIAVVVGTIAIISYTFFGGGFWRYPGPRYPGSADGRRAGDHSDHGLEQHGWLG